MIKIIPFFADFHCGSSVGLIKPEPWNLEKGDTYHPSPAQVHVLWDQMEKCVGRIKHEIDRVKKSKQERPKLILNFVGDMRDGDHHQTPQILTSYTAEQTRIAIDCIEWILNQLDYDPKYDNLIFYAGTEEHSGAGGEAEEYIARDFEGVVPLIKPNGENDGKFVWERKRFKCNGQTFDVKHKWLSVGGREWTEENAIYSSIKSRQISDTRRGKEITNWDIGAHNHKYAIATYETKFGISRGVLLPCFQLKTHYAYSLQPRLSTIGAFCVIVNSDGTQRYFSEYLELEEDKIEEL